MTFGGEDEGPTTLACTLPLHSPVAEIKQFLEVQLQLPAEEYGALTYNGEALDDAALIEQLAPKIGNGQRVTFKLSARRSDGSPLIAPTRGGSPPIGAADGPVLVTKQTTYQREQEAEYSLAERAALVGVHYHLERMPSYCDRVLALHGPGNCAVRVGQGSALHMRGLSDHDPLWASFDVNYRDAPPDRPPKLAASAAAAGAKLEVEALSVAINIDALQHSTSAWGQAWGQAWAEAGEEFRPRLRIELLSAAIDGGRCVVKGKERVAMVEAAAAGIEGSTLQAHFEPPPLSLAATWLAEAQRHEHAAPLGIHVSCNVDEHLVPLGSARIDLRGVSGCPQASDATQASPHASTGADCSDAALEKLFKELDTDGNGCISRAEMEAAMSQLHDKQIEPRQLDEMMQAAKTGGRDRHDGEVTLAEFKAVMTPHEAVKTAPAPGELPLVWCGVRCGTLSVKLAFRDITMSSKLPSSAPPASAAGSAWRTLLRWGTQDTISFMPAAPSASQQVAQPSASSYATAAAV